MIRPMLLAGVLSFAFFNAAGAQEFRVLTRIHDASRPANMDAAPLAHSLTLFHAGLTYDFVGPAGELIVFDPGNRRFTLLSTATRVSTVVDFDQVRRLNKLARTETERVIAELEATAAPRERIDAVRFQLNPRFEETFESATNTLVLSSPALTYRVTCADDADPAAVESYLRYADWMARLNHVLHPGAFPPAPRLALNEALRKRRLFPLTVELDVAGDRRIALRAEHQTRWSFSSYERRSIHNWKSLLRDEDTKSIDFHGYQRAVLTADTAP